MHSSNLSSHVDGFLVATKQRQEDDASTFLAAANEGADWLAANADAEAEEIHEKREELEGHLGWS